MSYSNKPKRPDGMPVELPGVNQTSEEQAFVAIAPLYDELMTGVPYTDWITYLHTLLEERNARPRRILDLACGTGNVTELLAQEGYDVTGVDIAPEMITQARHKAAEHGLAIGYHVQDAAELDLPGERFDLCISLFDSLNYIIEPDRLARALTRVVAHLTGNGLFIFDPNTDFALVNQFFDQDNLGSDDRLRYQWRSEYFADTRLCRVQMRFWFRQDDGTDRIFEEIHWQYAYRSDEVIAMLSQAGFNRITLYKAYTLRPPVRTTDRIFYIAQKQ